MNLSSLHSRLLLLWTWFVAWKNRDFTEVTFTWCTCWASTKFAQSHIWDAAGLLYYYVDALSINWFGLTPPPLLIFSVTLLNALPKIFEAHTLYSAHPSIQHSRRSKKKINLRFFLYPDYPFLHNRTHYIGALLPKLVP